MSSTSIAVGDGTKIHFVDEGPIDTPAPVVLVHGITESCMSWSPILERLVTAGHRVIAVDLRGHGESGTAETYALEALVGDVAAVVTTTIEDPSKVRLVGHSLGGTVVSAVASAMPVQSVVNVDQPLELAAFQAQLQQLAPLLRDSDSFVPTMLAIFDEIAGEVLDPAERARLDSVRNPVQEVVLGVWEPVIQSSADDLAALVRAAAGSITAPYLSLHGIDPGSGYATWLTSLVPTAIVEVWAGTGHYPHLVDPGRFVARIEQFWQDS